MHIWYIIPNLFYKNLRFRIMSEYPYKQIRKKKNEIVKK